MKVFEVKFVEHEAVFYQMGSLQTYDLRCELFEYSHERLDTGVQEIDNIEETHSGNFLNEIFSEQGKVHFVVVVVVVLPCNHRRNYTWDVEEMFA